MGLLLLLLGFAVALALLHRIALLAGSTWTHAHVFSLTWGATLLTAELALDGALAPSTPALALLVGAWWSFLAGCLLVLARAPPALLEEASQRRLRPWVGRLLVAALIALQAIAAYFELRSSGSFPGSADEFAAMRISGALLVTESIPMPFGPFRWGYVLYVPLAFALCAQRSLSRPALAATVLAGAVLGFLKFTRAPLLQLAAVALWSWHSTFRPPARRSLVVVALLAIVLGAVFTSTQDLLIQATSLTTNTKEAILPYLAASPRAFAMLLRQPGMFGKTGFYSLDFLYVPLEKLSIVASHPSLLRPVVDFPDVAVSTNLFTFLDAYTADFGPAGAVIGALVTGALATAVHSHAVRTRRVGPLVASSYLAYCCFMASANNEFIRASVPIYLFLAWMLDRAVTDRGSFRASPG